MKGPFDLGIFSRPVAFVACTWIAFITVVLCLPTANPVTSETLNYAVVAVAIIGVGTIISWVFWVHKWFTGPSEEVAEAMRLGVDPLEPGALEAREKQEEEKKAAGAADAVSE